MTQRLTRRGILRNAVVLLSAGWRSAAARPLVETAPDIFAALEQKAGGRLGVAVLDSRTGKRFGHRIDERFALCSTFKFLAAAAVLPAWTAERNDWIASSATPSATCSSTRR